MGRTKDENFVLMLYKEANERGDLEARLNKFEIGAKIGLHPRAVKAICRLLVQANFIRKEGEEEIYLTSHGLQLAVRLLGES